MSEATQKSGVTEDDVMEVLGDIYDPEIPIDIVNLGLVYQVAIEGSRVDIDMTMTSPGCPRRNSDSCRGQVPCRGA